MGHSEMDIADWEEVMAPPECVSMRREKVCPLENAVEGTHIRFKPDKPKEKTKTWLVENKYGEGVLGRVQWFGRWRKYAFFPFPDTVFEQVCMREIAAFIEGETVKHNAVVRERRAAGGKL
jgi:hypothetical protein